MSYGYDQPGQQRCGVMTNAANRFTGTFTNGAYYGGGGG